MTILAETAAPEARTTRTEIIKERTITKKTRMLPVLLKIICIISNNNKKHREDRKKTDQ